MERVEMKRAILVSLCFVSGLFLAGTLAAQCTATQGEILDATYKSHSPMRSSVGKGYALTGIVRASGDCQPLSGATVEFWMAGPDGAYRDSYRGTAVTDRKGVYRIETVFPAASTGMPPHIHMAVAADGFVPIQTECFPAKGSAAGTFDVVLEPGG
jgi:protocatechuate 3,4-dioxygenase beta subunit